MIARRTGRTHPAPLARMLAAAVILTGCEARPDPGTDGGETTGDAAEDGDPGTDAPDGPPTLLPDPERMVADIDFLASAALAGRETGSPGNAAAADFIERRFRDLGLEPAGDDGAYRHRFDMQLWRFEAPPELTIGAEPLVYAETFSVHRYSPPAEGEVELVFVGYGVVVPPFDPADHPDCRIDPAGHDDRLGADLVGKAALLLPGAPGGDASTTAGCPVLRRLEAMAEAGAVAMVSPPAAAYGDAPLHGITLWPDRPHPIPSFQVSRAVLDRFLPEFPEWTIAADAWRGEPHATGVTIRYALAASETPIVAENVVGRIPGTDPLRAGEVVIVGAHFDHLGPHPAAGTIYPGADDNASGTAVMLELARGLVEAVPRPARSVLFAAWNAEEHGLQGACAYAPDPPTHTTADTFAVINVDEAGGGNGTGLAVFGGEEPRNRFLTDLLRTEMEARRYGGRLLVGPPATSHDAACFASLDVPVLTTMTLGAHPYVHTPGDVPAAIDPEDLRAAATMLGFVLLPLARGAEASAD